MSTLSIGFVIIFYVTVILSGVGYYDNMTEAGEWISWAAIAFGALYTAISISTHYGD